MKGRKKVQAYRQLEREGNSDSMGNRECKSSLFIWKRCVSSLCTSAKTGFRWSRWKKRKKPHCPWIQRGKKEGCGCRWSRVTTKIYIFMKKRVYSGPWPRHWFEAESIVHLWCDAESCLSGWVGLTWAVFILLLNEKTAMRVWTDTQLPT